MRSFCFIAWCSAGLAGLAALTATGPAGAQGTQPSWIDPALLAAGKAEGSLVVYTSTNEQEGLPLFKIFEDATGIKVEYVGGSDSQMTGRLMSESRATQRC